VSETTADLIEDNLRESSGGNSCEKSNLA